MKNLCVWLSGFAFLLLNVDAKAQQKDGADYFVGKWEVAVKDTPEGDVTMFFLLDKADDSVSGVVQDTSGNEISKISNTELQGDELTVYFAARGYDLNLWMKKKDDDNITGTLMGMFDANGKRMKKD